MVLVNYLISLPEQYCLAKMNLRHALDEMEVHISQIIAVILIRLLLVGHRCYEGRLLLFEPFGP